MRRLLFAMVLVAAMCLSVQAHGIGVTYTDKVVWRGFELSDESDALAPQINVDIGGVNVMARGLLMEETDYEDIDNWDAQVSIKRKVDPFVVTTGFGYFDYPDGGIEFQELWATIGLPVGPVTPRYTLVRAESEGAASEAGWLHVAGLDLELTEQADLFAEAVYNDGFSPFGDEIESDWSHVTVGASLDVPVGGQLVLTPAVYYQRTLEAAINPERDQVWYAAGLCYRF